MVEALYPFRTLPLLEKMAAFTERRHDVLAGNIANISTPGYKTRDLPVKDFQEALKRSIANQQTTSPTLFETFRNGSSPPVDSQAEFPQELFQAVERPPKDLVFQDGSNRNIEREVMEMTKNSMIQNFTVELMAAQLNLMGAVISERP